MQTKPETKQALKSKTPPSPPSFKPSPPSITIEETAITLVAEGVRLEGKITFDSISRVHGTLVGEVIAKMGSTLILSETAVVEGQIQADTLWIDGFVQGTIHAKTRVVISRTGRVVGEVRTPSLKIEQGAFFEGRCEMNSPTPSSTPVPRTA